MVFDPSATRSGTEFTTVPSYQAVFICYINGVLVPIMGYSTSTAVWEIPQFTVHLVPDLRLQRLGNEDRIPIQIFALDYWVNPEKPEFRIVIDGEIVGWQMSSYRGQRSMSFTAFAHINNLEELNLFYMTNVDDIVAAQSPEVLAQGASEGALLYPYALFHQGLISTAAQIQDDRNPNRTPTAAGDEEAPTAPTAQIKAPYELVYNVIRGVIGKEVPDKRRSLPAMNYFARHIRKTRLNNRFVRLPYLEDPDQIGEKKGVFPIFNAARNDAAIGAMRRDLVSEIGNSGSAWQMLRQVLGTVYMEIGMIPNPTAVIVELNTPNGQYQDGKILRLLTSDEPVQRQGTPAQSPPDVLQERAEELARTILAAVYGRASLAPGVLQEAGLTSLPNSAIEVDVTAIRDHLERLHGQRGFSSQPTPPPTDARPEGVDAKTPVRLAQHFVKPEFLFGIPPHCNVIFPPMVVSWAYDESYKNQPTRTYVNDSVMSQLLRASGPNRHFLLHALSVGYPEEANAIMEHKVGGDTEEATTRATPAMLESGKNCMIWPEEFFAGPKTQRFAVPKWFQMLRQFSNGPKAPASTDAPPAPGSAASRPLVNAPSQPTPLVTGTQTLPTISEARRGMVYTRAASRPDFAYRWLITAETLAAGNRHSIRYSLPKYRDLTPRGTVRPRGSTESVPNYQQQPAQALRVLADHLRSVFGSVITHFEYTSGFPPINPPLTNTADPHIAGRAVDIMLRTVRRGGLYSMPDLEHGNPIAEYLVQNANVFGIQYIVWARSQWNGSKPAGSGTGKRFEHYARAPDSERFDHFNHLHVEITEEAALAQLPFYASRGAVANTPPRPAQTVFGPPNTAGLITRLPVNANPPPITRTVDVAQPGTSAGPLATRTVTRTITPPGNQAEGAASQDDSFQALFELYAQYQHLKSRYMQRRMAVRMLHNPYITVGFPAMMFDSMNTRMHTVGYVQQVTQSGDANGTMSTDATLTCCRTFAEFMADVRTDAERFGARVTVAPAEVVDEVRAQIQDEENAEKFYRRIFYGDAPRPGNVSAAFRWTEAVGYSDGLTTIPIEIVGESVAQTVARQQAATEARRAAANPDSGVTPSTNETSQPNATTPTNSALVAGVSSQQQQTVTSNIDPNRELSPRENIYQDAFVNYDIAMQLAARPVCSLSDFIRFWHGGQTVNALLSSGDVEGPNEAFSYATVQERDVIAVGAAPDGVPVLTRGTSERKTAVFYRRIFKLRPGPGTGEDHLTPPSDAEVGYLSNPLGPSPTHAGVPADYPETRADWDTVLLAYAETVMYLLRPQT